VSLLHADPCKPSTGSVKGAAKLERRIMDDAPPGTRQGREKRFGRKPVLDGEQRQKALHRLADGALISAGAREMKTSRATIMRVGRAGSALPL
jgi:hypothetical protein